MFSLHGLSGMSGRYYGDPIDLTESSYKKWLYGAFGAAGSAAYYGGKHALQGIFHPQTYSNVVNATGRQIRNQAIRSLLNSAGFGSSNQSYSRGRRSYGRRTRRTTFNFGRKRYQGYRRRTSYRRSYSRYRRRY